MRAAGLTEEARQQRELTEALGRVPHEVLLALDELLDAIERGEDPDALVDILADPRKNVEPPSAKLPS